MQLAFGLAGAYAGSFFGVTSLGWGIGVYLGGLLEGQKSPPMQFGPQISDLKAPQTASPGLMLTIAFGTIRLPVTMIWGPDKVQHEKVTTIESEGGKGSPPDQKQTTYYATADAAYAVCEGPIVGFRKWWLNSKLAQDASAESPVESRLASIFELIKGESAAVANGGFLNVLTTYTGSETQVQDPTIAEQEGAADTPGYRGTAYFAFNDLDLSPYFQNHPQVEVETVVAGTHSILVPEVLYTLPGGLEYAAVGPEDFGARRNSEGAYHFWTVIDDGGDPKTIAAFQNHHGGAQVLSRTHANNVALMSNKGLNGRAWYQEHNTAVRAISASGQVWEFANYGLEDGENRLENLYEFAPTLLMGFSQEEHPEIFLQYKAGPSTFNILHGYASAMGGLAAVTTGHSTNVFFETADLIPGRIYIRCTSFSGTDSTIGYCVVGTAAFTTLRTYNTFRNPDGLVGRDGYLYVRSADTGFLNVIEKMDEDGAVIDSLTLPGLASTSIALMRMVQDSNGLLYVQVDGEIYRINCGTMEVLAQATLPHISDWILPGDTFEGRGVLVARGAAGYMDKLYVIGPDTVAADYQPLSDVTATILSMRGGYDPTEYDVTLLTSIPVRGYAIRRRTSRRNMLAPLFDANFVDMVESDGVLKCVPRGSASVITIPESDLGAHTGDRDEPVETLRIRRQEELDHRSPVEVTVLYIRKESDYQVGMQNSRRLATPSKHAITIEYPIVFTDDEAKRIADKKAFSLEYERETYEFTTGRKYAYLEPTDVITVVKGGVEHIMRLVDKKEGGNGVFEWVGVADLSSLQSQISFGVVPSAMTAQVLSLVGPTVPEFLDVPLLRDQDDNAGFIWGARGVTDGWLGAQLYQSLDSGVTYVPLGPIATEASIGYTLNALGAYDPERNEFIDEGNYLDVVILSGSTPASLTREELLDNGNPCVAGGEPMQYRDAELIAANTYRLTGLLRGRRGSEEFRDTHVVGERFVLLDAKLRSLDTPVTQLNQPIYYKAVTLGRTLAQTSPVVFTNTGRRKKPLAPVHVGAGKNTAGDWLIQWQRRTRYEPLWFASGDVPLGENIEQYNVLIRTSAGVLKRTLVAYTNSVTYTAAQQVADFGATKATLYGEVVQVSGEVGEGYVTSFDFNPADPYASQVVLLMHFDGTHGSVIFTDEVGHSTSKLGSASITTAQSKFGGASGNLVLGQVIVANSVDWEFDTGDFTIEFWIRLTAFTIGARVLSRASNSSHATPFKFHLTNGGQAYISIASTAVSGFDIASTQQFGTYMSSTWQHVALTRSGNVWRAFLDGVQGWTTTNASPMWAGTEGIHINGTNGMDPAEFQMDELRITKGFARYVNNFPPPTAPGEV